jgi:hypothetical protein
VILLLFWAARPAAWFVFSVGKFQEKAVVSQCQQFDILLVALPEKILYQIMDVVENVPEDFAFNTLKDRLLETHILSDQEKINFLYKLELLDRWKPSQMLTIMLAYCFSGMNQTIVIPHS